MPEEELPEAKEMARMVSNIKLLLDEARGHIDKLNGTHSWGTLPGCTGSGKLHTTIQNMYFRSTDDNHEIHSKDHYYKWKVHQGQKEN